MIYRFAYFPCAVSFMCTIILKLSQRLNSDGTPPPLISAIVSLEMGLLSDGTLLDFGMAISTAVLSAVTIKSAHLSRSLVDVSPVKSAELSTASSVDWNTSLSVWLSLYLVRLIDH